MNTDFHVFSIYAVFEILSSCYDIWYSDTYVWLHNYFFLPVISNWWTCIGNSKENFHIFLLLSISSHSGSKTLYSSIFGMHYAAFYLKERGFFMISIKTWINSNAFFCQWHLPIKPKEEWVFLSMLFQFSMVGIWIGSICICNSSLLPVFIMT